jgi:hypothetical protein
MHIAHHVTAARYAHWHLGLGAAATGLAAIVGASIFATLTKLAADVGPIAIVCHCRPGAGQHALRGADRRGGIFEAR